MYKKNNNFNISAFICCFCCVKTTKVALSCCQQDAQYWWPFKFLSLSRSTQAFISGMKGLRKVTVYNHGVYCLLVMSRTVELGV
jgi:hypothetical protein